MEKKELSIFIGRDASTIKKCPMVLTTNAPYISWQLPSDINQLRYNLKIHSLTTNALYISGIKNTTEQYHQWPTGAGMSDLWLGVVHIEILIGDIPNKSTSFSYTSGSYEDFKDKSSVFCYDTLGENIFNTNNVSLNWKNSFDLNFEQDLTYHVQMCENPLFIYDVVFDDVIKDSERVFSAVIASCESQSTYYWRCRAFDGLDYSEWSIVNGFKTVDNTPPVIEIISVLPLENDFGDVEIQFQVIDTNHESVSVICEYLGGNQGIEKYPCSLTSTLNRIETSKIHKILWRSSINEKKIETSDYMILMTPYDTINFGLEVTSELFHLDNRRFGLPSSDFGNVEIEFPLKCEFKIKPSIQDYKEQKGRYAGSFRDSPVVWHNYWGWNDDNAAYKEFELEVGSSDKGMASVYDGTRTEEQPYRLPQLKNQSCFKLNGPEFKYYTLYHHGREMHQEVKHAYKDPNESLDSNAFPQTYGWDTRWPLSLESHAFRPSELFGFGVIEESKSFQKNNPNRSWPGFRYGRIFWQTQYYRYSRWHVRFEGLGANYYGLNQSVNKPADGHDTDIYEDNWTEAPLYTLNPDILASNGYPIELHSSDWNKVKFNQQVYVKKYTNAVARREPDPTYGYKDFRVIPDGNGGYKRVPLGHRGEQVTLGMFDDIETTEDFVNFESQVILVAIPIYVKMEQAIYNPDKLDTKGLATIKYGTEGGGFEIVKENKYLLVPPNPDFFEDWYHENVIWDPTFEIFHETPSGGFSTYGANVLKNSDPLEEYFGDKPKEMIDHPWTGRYDYDKLHRDTDHPSTFSVASVERAKQWIESDYDYKPITSLSNFIKADQGFRSKKAVYGKETEKYEDLDYTLIGSLSELFEYYKSSYADEFHPGNARRFDPTYKGDQGFQLNGKFTMPQTISALKIVYLQEMWDAFNTIHWEATLGVMTKIHLQYKNYNDETEWFDAQVENGAYNEELNMYLTDNMTWSSFLNTFSLQDFLDGKTYRFRLRLVDIYSKTYSDFVYSGDFLIDHNSINPANITEVKYEPWSKALFITFRIDDTQGDLYDIIGISYTSDGRTWYEAHISNLEGQKRDLESNKIDAKVIKTHTLKFNTSGYFDKIGANYRVRLKTTLAGLRENVDLPIFQWKMQLNHLLGTAEIGAEKLEGHLQYYDLDDAGVMVPIEEPILAPGKIIRMKSEIEQIKKQPAPLGMYEFFEDNDDMLPCIDKEGFNDWLFEDLGGLTRSDMLQILYQQLEDYEIELDGYIKQTILSEMEIRRNCIKVGFYNNGFVDNDPENIHFRFRVESAPYDPTLQLMSPSLFDQRFSPYIRIQLDPYDTFDSQRNNKPLRDILYDEDNRITAAKSSNNNYATPGLGSYTEPTPYENNNQNAPSNTEITNNVNLDGDEGITGKYVMPSSLFPGEREPTYLNESFPSVTDEIGDLESWERPYHWRLCSYNIINTTHYEKHQCLINNTEHTNDNVNLTVEITGSEELGTFYHNYGTYYPDSYSHRFYLKGSFSVETKPPEWEYTEDVNFITDKPKVDGIVVGNDNYKNWYPFSYNRQKPCVIIDEDFNYYLFYNKHNTNKTQNIIMQAMSKDGVNFGEYAQCFPYEPFEELEESYFSAHILKKANDYYMWTSCSDNKIYYLETNQNFNSWSEKEECIGLENKYAPCVIYKNGKYHMWIGGFDTTSKIYYYISDDRINWTIQNNGNAVYETSNDITTPNIVIINNEYRMFLTEYIETIPKIISVISTDGINWTNYNEEILNAYNPCVILDRYKCNEELRIYYNISETEMKTAILNDRVWIKKTSGNTTNGFYGQRTNISAVIQNTKTLNYSLRPSVSGLNENDIDENFKVRLNFAMHSNTKDFIIQGEWLKNIEDVITPNTNWRYKEILKSLTY